MQLYIGRNASLGQQGITIGDAAGAGVRGMCTQEGTPSLRVPIKFLNIN